MMCRKALRVRARDLHIEPAQRVLVNVRRRRAAFRRPTTLVGILWRAVDVVETFEAAVAVSSRRLLRRWRGLFWPRGRWWPRGVRDGRSRGGQLIPFLTRAGSGGLLHAHTLSLNIVRCGYVVPL